MISWQILFVIIIWFVLGIISLLKIIIEHNNNCSISATDIPIMIFIIVIGPIGLFGLK